MPVATRAGQRDGLGGQRFELAQVAEATGRGQAQVLADIYRCYLAD